MTQSVFNKGNRSGIVTFETNLRKVLAAVVGTATIPVNGKMYTVAQAETLLDSHIAAQQTLVNLKGQTHNAVVAAEALLDEVKEFVTGLRDFAAGNFGVASNQYTTLGFTPPKKAAKTAAIKAEAAVKSGATRDARHTMGKVQKKAIHGTATTAPASSAPAPATPASSSPKTPNS
jgi:hypothetical protein